ncbi:MAG: phosphotriesterase [Armatimonadota bacterium]|nr:phosphotriesterase [bacterium]MDW8321542.1 phosphotriesterase [Armatimonadota bacterium]
MQQVTTTTGKVAPERLDVVLPHEHVLVDFIGADRVSRSRYDPEEVYRVALPYLQRLKQAGCRTLVECTPAYLGRDPQLLQRLSKASGLYILTNTGWYGAANDKYLPARAYSLSAEQIASEWVTEAQKGIEGTTIRPGFIKIGVDPEPSEVDMRLVEAAALTHRKTGLTIASHTGPGSAARKQIERLEQLGVRPSAFIWVHAQVESDRSMHVWAAERGAWVEFDGVSPETIDQHAQYILHLRQKGLLGRVLVSHDAGWYHVGEPGGGTFREYTTLFTHLLPELRKAGLTDKEIEQLTAKNPQRAFAGA